MPERERVARMQAAVRELGDPLERQIVELEELPHTGEVEQTVALHGRSGNPEEHADDGSPEEHPHAARDLLRLGPTPEPTEHACRECDENDQREREGERRAEREGQGERAEHDDEGPSEARGHAAHAERPRDEPAGCENDCRRERELEVQPDHRQRPSNAATSPDASHAAPSRYVRPRSPRNTTPRSRSDIRSRRRARSASFAPRCFQRKSRCPRRFSR